MRKEELLQKNVILGGEFTKYVLEHPELLETIPKGACVFVLPENDPELLRANLELARKRVEEGERVVYVRVKELKPASSSRLVNPKIEVQVG